MSPTYAGKEKDGERIIIETFRPYYILYPTLWNVMCGSLDGNVAWGGITDYNSEDEALEALKKWGVEVGSMLSDQPNAVSPHYTFATVYKSLNK